MRRFLLDVNVLIALIDSKHTAHDAAHQWFAAEGRMAWASCPLTQLGVIRVVSNAHYTNPPGSPAIVAESLRSLCGIGDHEFWADDLNFIEDATVHFERVLQAAHLTDTYLLALTSKHKGKLATFDRRLVTSAIAGGANMLHVLS